MGAKRFLLTNNAMCFLVVVTALFSTATALAEVRIVALGSSATRGKGLPESQAYPAQLEAALRAKGHQVTVTNQGANGDSTWILARLDSAVPPGTDIVILQIYGNDRLEYGASPDLTAANKRTIVERLRAKGVEVYTLLLRPQLDIINRADLHVESSRDPIHPNRWHLNAAGNAILVGRLLPAIEALVRKVERCG